MDDSVASRKRDWLASSSAAVVIRSAARLRSSTLWTTTIAPSVSLPSGQKGTALTRIHRSLGRTFLYVTNDQVEAMSMADQVAVLREGTVQQVGAPTEIYDNPANRWVATFVGSPRMNLLECTANGRLAGAGWSLPNPGFGVSGDAKALLGVRSEDLSLDVRNESAALDGTVYAVEPLGDRTLVDIEIGGQRVIVKAAPTTSFKIGDPVRASVDLDRVHLFDARSEAAIARR